MQSIKGIKMLHSL